MVRTRLALGALAVAVLAGCASTSATPGFHDLAGVIQHRTGYRLRWNQSTPDDRDAERVVRGLLDNPLSAEGAVQVALLNNPALQADYENLSVAQADVVQAGLLHNPIFSVGMTAAERDAIDPNLLVGVTQSFLDLLLIPARTRVAAAQFDAAKFRVGSDVFDVAAEVKRAFYTVEAAEQTLAVRRMIAEGEAAAFDLSREQAGVGNIGDLSLYDEKTLYLQTRLEVTKGEAEVAATREQLTHLMGLSQPTWRTWGRLPEMPPAESLLSQLEERALRERLDLAALRQEVQTLDYALSLAKTSRWTGVIDIGADVARLNDGAIAVGPRVSIELPVFDQRRGSIARLEAQLRASRQLLAERVVEVGSDVRSARDRMVYARRASEEYRTAIIPTRERVVSLSQEQYDAMLLGAHQLIAAKQSEVSAYREYIETVRDYWIARAELERAIGGGLLGAAAPVEPAPGGAPSAPPDAPPAPPAGHHHPS